MSAAKPFVWPLCYHQINGKSVGAYRIRPPWRGCCIFDGGDMVGDIISFPLTWGRMRYAPTPVRLNSLFYWVVGWCRIRPHQGVCDTPLHLFGYCHGWIQLIITTVRLNFVLCWVACWFRFRSHQGVCDTPLHLFGYCHGWIWLFIPPVRWLSGDDWG